MKNIKDLIDTSDEIIQPLPKCIYDPSEVLPTPKKIDSSFLDFWDYYRMSEKELRELTKDSKNEKIQDIRNKDYKLTKKQMMCLAIYLASKGKDNNYEYLLKEEKTRT